MVILGPRFPRKHQIHLHLEGKQRHPMSTTCTIGGGGGTEERSVPGVSRPLHARGPSAAPSPRTHHPHCPQRPVPIVATGRSFPSPTMTPFLSEQTHNKPGSGAGLDAKRRRPPPRAAQPRVAGAWRGLGGGTASSTSARVHPGQRPTSGSRAREAASPHPPRGPARNARPIRARRREEGPGRPQP